jgi:hypothetical protein
MLWEGDQVDCYGRCLELLREYGVEVWMRDREVPGFHCRMEDDRGFDLFDPCTLLIICALFRLDQQPWQRQYYTFSSSHHPASGSSA